MKIEPYIHLHDVHKITDYNKIVKEHVRLPKEGSVYACVDINCFYVQVESKLNKVTCYPLIVGGYRDNKTGIPKGIVATSNYPARAYGIKTGMSALEAQQLCEHVLMFQVDYDHYKAISKELETIFHHYSQSIEMYSLDEAFLDLSGHVTNPKEAETWVKSIKAEILETLDLTVNIGISITKTYSKILADLNKPDGHTIAFQEDVFRVLYPLKCSDIWGIAKRRASKLNGWGFQTIGQIAFARKQMIQKIFGPIDGEIVWRMAKGNEHTIIVDGKSEPKNISYMHTFPTWTKEFSLIWGEIQKAVERVTYRLRGFHMQARTFNIYFRPQNQQGFGAEFKLKHTNATKEILKEYYSWSEKLFESVVKFDIQIRGIGLFVTGLKRCEHLQYDIFNQGLARNADLDTAMDKIKNMGNFELIQFADSLNYVKGRTHFVDRS